MSPSRRQPICRRGSEHRNNLPTRSFIAVIITTVVLTKVLRKAPQKIGEAFGRMLVARHIGSRARLGGQLFALRECDREGVDKTVEVSAADAEASAHAAHEIFHPSILGVDDRDAGR